MLANDEFTLVRLGSWMILSSGSALRGLSGKLPLSRDPCKTVLGRKKSASAQAGCCVLRYCISASANSSSWLSRNKVSVCVLHVHAMICEDTNTYRTYASLKQQSQIRSTYRMVTALARPESTHQVQTHDAKVGSSNTVRFLYTV